MGNSPHNNVLAFRHDAGCRDYKNEKQWLRNNYCSAVSASDEAFVWQIMKFYYPVWVREHDERGSKKKSGPMKGFKNTASKTKQTYERQLISCGVSREKTTTTTWGARLMLVRQEHENKKRADQREAEAERVRTIVEPKDTGFLRFTLFVRRSANPVRRVCGDEEDDENSSTDTETAAATAATSVGEV